MPLTDFRCHEPAVKGLQFLDRQALVRATISSKACGVSHIALRVGVAVTPQFGLHHRLWVLRCSSMAASIWRLYSSSGRGEAGVAQHLAHQGNHRGRLSRVVLIPTLAPSPASPKLTWALSWSNLS